MNYLMHVFMKSYHFYVVQLTLLWCCYYLFQTVLWLFIGDFRTSTGNCSLAVDRRFPYIDREAATRDHRTCSAEPMFLGPAAVTNSVTSDVIQTIVH
jgi:hypothetical protein